MQSRLALRHLALVAAAFFVCLNAHADSVASGVFGISGSTTLTGTSITLGSATITLPLSGPFASLNGTIITVANIPSLSSPATSNWIQLPDGINFNLTGLDPGTGTVGNCSGSPGLGSQCTPTGTPFTFTTEPSGASLSFTVVGEAYTGSLAGGSSPFTAVFTSQFAGVTIPTLVAELEGTGLPSTYSATITTTAPTSTTPEPGTLISSMTGLLLIGWRVAERRRSILRN